jgi:hypothetical protein
VLHQRALHVHLAAAGHGLLKLALQSGMAARGLASHGSKGAGVTCRSMLIAVLCCARACDAGRVNRKRSQVQSALKGQVIHLVVHDRVHAVNTPRSEPAPSTAAYHVLGWRDAVVQLAQLLRLVVVQALGQRLLQDGLQQGCPAQLHCGTWGMQGGPVTALHSCNLHWNALPTQLCQAHLLKLD